MFSCIITIWMMLLEQKEDVDIVSSWFSLRFSAFDGHKVHFLRKLNSPFDMNLCHFHETVKSQLEEPRAVNEGKFFIAFHSL